MARLTDLQRLVEDTRTESGEKNAVARFLQDLGHRKIPTITTLKDGMRIVRTYLWRDTPMGNVALVTGPSLDGQVFVVEPVHGDVHAEDVTVYLPASGRLPAYAAFKPGRGHRAAAAPSRAPSRTPARRAVSRRNPEEEDPLVSVPLDHATLTMPQSVLTDLVSPIPLERCSPDSLMYDANGQVYRVFYTVIATEVNGDGPILASNKPRSFAPTPDYPTVFQARALNRPAERQKITRISQDLDPMRLVLPHGDPTFGPPVVWEGNGEGTTKAGRFYVLGGNSRTIALLMASGPSYQQYVTAAKRFWPDIWPSERPPTGSRWVLVRVAASTSCPTLRDALSLNAMCQLSLREAQGLAGATQLSMSGAETPLGEALSLIRGLGLSDLGTDLPPIAFEKTVARDTVKAFMAEPVNRAFLQALRSKMGAERFDSMMGDVDNAAKLINSVLMAFLPPSIIEEGFVTTRQEQALMAMLAPAVTIVFGEKQGSPPIPAGYDLLPYLTDARSILRVIEKMSLSDTLSEFDRMSRQTTLGGSVGLGADTPAQAMLLALVFKKAEAARDPSYVIEAVMHAYVEAAREAAMKADTRQGGLFGASSAPSAPAPDAPAKALLAAVEVGYGPRAGEVIQRTMLPIIEAQGRAPAPVPPVFSPPVQPPPAPPVFLPPREAPPVFSPPVFSPPPPREAPAPAPAPAPGGDPWVGTAHPTAESLRTYIGEGNLTYGSLLAYLQCHTDTEVSAALLADAFPEYAPKLNNGQPNLKAYAKLLQTLGQSKLLVERTGTDGQYYQLPSGAFASGHPLHPIPQGDWDGVREEVSMLFTDPRIAYAAAGARKLNAALCGPNGEQSRVVIAQATATEGVEAFSRAVNVCYTVNTFVIGNFLRDVALERFDFPVWVPVSGRTDLVKLSGSGSARVGDQVRVMKGDMAGRVGIIVGTTHSSDPAEKEALMEQARFAVQTSKAKLIAFPASGGWYANLAKGALEAQGLPAPAPAPAPAPSADPLADALERLLGVGTAREADPLADALERWLHAK